MVIIIIIFLQFNDTMFIHTLPAELRHSRKDLINIMNKYKQCFRWYQIRDLNLIRRNPQPIKYLSLLFFKKVVITLQQKITSFKNYNVTGFINYYLIMKTFIVFKYVACCIRQKNVQLEGYI